MLLVVYVTCCISYVYYMLLLIKTLLSCFSLSKYVETMISDFLHFDILALVFAFILTCPTVCPAEPTKTRTA